MNLRDFSSVKCRREEVEKKMKVDLMNIGNFSLDESVASTRNCENMIGVAQVPLGLAGPLKINGSSFEGDFYIPLATTEGALVASVNRGAKAITLSGGAKVEAENIGATRGPVFKAENIEQRNELLNLLNKNFLNIKKTAESTSSHLKLLKYEFSETGRFIYVRFYFDTQDAMGLNMITIATNAIVDYIEKHSSVKCISLSGNFCVDKKPAWQNVINKRGKAVKAEVIIPEKVLKEILKTSASEIYEVWLAKCMIGGAMSGSMGFNAHVANVIAAIFIATGQDPAHVVEGSLTMTTAEVIKGKDLYISVHLPSLMVGTVGGGTGLGTQKEALSILGVAGPNEGKNALKFSEIIGAAVLAGELSLLSSLEQGTLAKAHSKLGRGGK